ncbi:MAG: ABC transporter ATP-binding protein [Deltaproteobacteria bacterium]|nr:MAG: ABC transporter ATP-binding protein [Deltaproteobacteria bacterium]TMB15566.1 MAG: ABC transporter ATP-binding protein [Deltaproteobacteria bacterium]
MTLLEVHGLATAFEHEHGAARAVDGVSFTLEAGQVLGLVGESGCGKSVTALSLMRLVPLPGRVVAGEVLLEGRELLALPEREMRRLRGPGMAMIFQEPMTSLNPVLRVGSQIAEAVRIHGGVGRRAAWDRAVELLGEVGIPEPATRARDYPHQLSGGMRQRVMIAMAISCSPKVLIADEPTTALDVTIQAEILDLLRTLRERHRMAVLLITHDLGVVAEQADAVAIMYAGHIVEYANVFEIFDRPLHPYTQALFRSMPSLGGRRERLEAIGGQVPDPFHLPSGCAFRDRCPRAVAMCATAVPPLVEKVADHRAACIRVEEFPRDPA